MLNALTVDLEDYFHVSNFETCIPKNRWDVLPIRIEESTIKLLDILSAYQVKATFFVLGWIAERLKSLIKKIDTAGHEISCHGYGHRLAYDMKPAEFRDDLRRAKGIIEDAIGRKVEGHRATSYSIVRSNLDYLRILAEEGFSYDSSIFPVHHDRYGIPEWYRFPKMVKKGNYDILEVPPSTFKIFGFNIPMAGGGYLRLLPVQFLSYCINWINKKEGKPAVLYVHPWEFDLDQPRIKISAVKAFRHYNNLQNTEAKVSHLLSTFKFSTVSEILNAERDTL
jgi:polysaccharide deacetylase family protein (PEP-CTERM system associated)